MLLWSYIFFEIYIMVSGWVDLILIVTWHPVERYIELNKTTEFWGCTDFTTIIWVISSNFCDGSFQVYNFFHIIFFLEIFINKMLCYCGPTYFLKYIIMVSGWVDLILISGYIFLFIISNDLLVKPFFCELIFLLI